MKTFIVSLFIAFSIVTPVLAAENLVYNSSLETIHFGDTRYPTGTPIGWLRGGYGRNSRWHDIVTCPGGYRGCPYPDAAQVSGASNTYVQVGLAPYQTTTEGPLIEGDVKWFFSDIEIEGNKTFTVRYDYLMDSDRMAFTPEGTRAAEAGVATVVVRYLRPDGTYRYSDIGDMHTPLPNTWGGMGAIPWQHDAYTFTAPNDAVSFTVFFALKTPGNLGIDNVTVEPATLGATNRSALLDQIASLEAEIARLQGLLTDLRSRV